MPSLTPWPDIRYVPHYYLRGKYIPLHTQKKNHLAEGEDRSSTPDVHEEHAEQVAGYLNQTTKKKHDCDKKNRVPAA